MNKNLYILAILARQLKRPSIDPNRLKQF